MIVKTVADVFAWYHANQFAIFSEGAEFERRRVRALFAAQHGNKEHKDCIPAMLWEFIAKQKTLTSNWTRRRWRNTILAPFSAAFRARIISANPFTGLIIPEGPGGRDWSRQEFQAMMRASSPPLRRLIVFWRFGGARPGEGRTLQWPEVFEDAQVCVQQKHKTAHITHHARHIHFNTVIAKLLLWLKKRRWGSVHVFLNNHKRPWTNGSITKQIRAARRRAGLQEDVVANGCRHAFAVGCILNGVDLATTAELMNHSDISTTRRYVHLAKQKSHLNAAAERAIGRKV